MSGLLTVTDEYRRYAISRLEEALKRSLIELKSLESICGILTWISFIFDAGKPRRNIMYRALSSAKAQGCNIKIKGELRSARKCSGGVML